MALDTIHTWIDGPFTSLSQTTPTPQQMGRDPWIMVLTKALAPSYSGPYDSGWAWWVVDQAADRSIIARTSADNQHLVGFQCSTRVRTDGDTGLLQMP